MKMHIYNMDIPLDDHKHEYYRQYKYAYGTFEFDTTDKELLDKFIEWKKEFCVGENVIFDTFASYEMEGVKDVTVIAFVEEADAVAFKLMWT